MRNISFGLRLSQHSYKMLQCSSAMQVCIRTIGSSLINLTARFFFVSGTWTTCSRSWRRRAWFLRPTNSKLISSGGVQWQERKRSENAELGESRDFQRNRSSERELVQVKHLSQTACLVLSGFTLHIRSRCKIFHRGCKMHEDIFFHV